jgi:signal transduction histidine kinase
MCIPTRNVNARNVGRRVVVISEDMSRCVALVQPLDRAGFEIVRATAQDRADAIVLDLKGVGEPGLAALWDLRKRAPVIVALDRDDPDLIRHALALGASDTLSPDAVLSTELAPRVEAAIQRAAADRLLRGELEKAQRVQALGMAAATTAHDFNNLLMTILGSADVLLQGPEGLSPEIAPGLRRIQEAAELADALTKELLAFVRRGAVAERGLISIDDVVRKSLNLLRALAGKAVTLETDLTSPQQRVRGSSARIEQVLLNLVVNARNALPEGGVIRIETNEVLDGDQRRLALRVRDNGVGMSAEARSRLFEWGFTSRPETGTGLGLALSRAIVEEHGGAIRVESTPGQFTTVTILLPVELASADPVARPVLEP